MKIEEIRKAILEINDHLQIKVGRDKGRWFSWEIRQDGLRMTDYACGIAGSGSWEFNDEEVMKLRDWLCELYGLPEKK